MESVEFVSEMIVLGTASSDANFTHADNVIAFPFENVTGFNATVPVWVVPGNCKDIDPNFESTALVFALLVAKYIGLPVKSVLTSDAVRTRLNIMNSSKYASVNAPIPKLLVFLVPSAGYKRLV